MATLVDVVDDFFTAAGWPVEPLDEDPAARRARWSQGEQELDCVVVTDEHTRMVVVYALCPDQAHPAALGPATELLSRANWGLPLGNFELDHDDGEIRFTTGIDVEDAALSPSLVRNLVLAALAAMDQYLPAIRAVLGGAVPAEALAAVESPN